MFVLVIMSHGQRGDIILDVDKNPVDLVKVYNLLSPAKFPAMAGKPKMVIVQACSGGKKLVGYHIYAFNNLYFPWLNDNIASMSIHQATYMLFPYALANSLSACSA